MGNWVEKPTAEKSMYAIFDIKHKYILVFVALFLLLLANSLTGQVLTIKIQNKTGYKIDSLIIGTKYIGTIEKDSAIGPIPFEKFSFDSGAPYESISGLVAEKHLKNEWWSWCGASRAVEEKGQFSFVLIIRQNSQNEYLLLE